MTTVRWILGLPFAAAVTVGLFVLMAGLIRSNDIVEVDPPRTVELDILAKLPKEDPPKPDGDNRRQIPKDPPEPVLYDPPPGKRPTHGPTPVAIEDGTRTPVNKNGITFTGSIVTPPPYPQSCLSRGVEGVVIVEFDVTPEGSVVNPRIIQTPHACFNRTVLNAASKWKYAPAMDNGKPVMRRNVRESIAFKLEN